MRRQSQIYSLSWRSALSITNGGTRTRRIQAHQHHHQLRYSNLIMSASSSTLYQPEKLIFAPGEKPPSPSTATDTTDNTTSDPSHQPPSQAAQFTSGTLHRRDLHPTSPFHQFHRWFNHPALQSNPGAVVPETCTLSTASLPSGRVSSRMVYLKELDARGFVIYSNWGTSQKARDFATNRHVALCFWWKGVERQVRVEGFGERLTTAESQVYFDTRARGSRLGAWASRQSEVLRPRAAGTGTTNSTTAPSAGDGGEHQQEDDGRAQLEDQVREVEKRFQGQQDIPVPDFWGGLRVIPDMVEFWQGRESRLHDRFRYQKVPPGDGEGGGDWKIERLNP